MMKQLIFLVIPLLFSCNSKVSKEEIELLNGYWEIEEVVFDSGEKKEYKANEVVDFIEIKNNKGFRKKLKPQITGTFIATNLEDALVVVDSANTTFLKTKSKYASWSDEIVSISKDGFSLKNKNGVVYKYKRYERIKF